MCERHVKHLGHLSAIGKRREGRVDARQNRGHVKARDRLVTGQMTEDLDGAGIESDLLTRFAQGSGADIRIARVLLATGKGDLAGMMPEGGGPLGEDHARLRSLPQNSDKHARRPQIAPRRKHDIGIEVIIRRAAEPVLERGEDRRKRISAAHPPPPAASNPSVAGSSA